MTQATIDNRELARHVLRLYEAIHPDSAHLLRWVMSGPQRDALVSLSRELYLDAFTPAPTPELPETLMGLPIRIDDQATALMLELK